MRAQAPHTPARRRAGLTLVEVAVVTVLLVIVLSSIAIVGRASDRAYRTGSIASHLESQVAVVMERVAKELEIAGIDTITPDPGAAGTSTIQFVQATGLQGGVVVWTPLRRLELELEAGELDDGIDNNGNELVDERALVLTEDPGGPAERRRILTHWVAELAEGEIANGVDDNGNGLLDEPGFVIWRVGETLVVRLTLARRTAEGTLLTRTARTSTRPRNRFGR